LNKKIRYRKKKEKKYQNMRQIKGKFLNTSSRLVRSSSSTPSTSKSSAFALDKDESHDGQRHDDIKNQ